ARCCIVASNPVRQSFSAGSACEMANPGRLSWYQWGADRELILPPLGVGTLPQGLVQAELGVCSLGGSHMPCGMVLCHDEGVSDPMADVLAAWNALKDAEARAEAMVAAARLEFGRAMYEARHLPPHLGRVKRDDIVAQVPLKGERLRQIE